METLVLLTEAWPYKINVILLTFWRKVDSLIKSIKSLEKLTSYKDNYLLVKNPYNSTLG